MHDRSSQVLSKLINELHPIVETWISESVVSEETLELENLLLDSDIRREVLTSSISEILVSAWSEVLRWAMKDRDELILDASMMPEDLGWPTRAWARTLGRMGIDEFEARHLLHKLAICRIDQTLILPWGGIISWLNGNARLVYPQ